MTTTTMKPEATTNDAMISQKNEMAMLFEACWSNVDFKDRFVSDPASVLADYDIDVPAGINVKVVENTADTLYITIPANPGKPVMLADGELNEVSGGSTLLHPLCPSCE